MQDKEIITKWKQGLSKNKLATMYKRQYNQEIKIIRSTVRHRHDGRYISNYEALAYVERVIYEYLKERWKTNENSTKIRKKDKFYNFIDRGNARRNRNNSNNELEIIVEIENGKYKKHFIYLNEWTMYVVEDVSGAFVDKYHYEINYLPEMIQPFTIKSKDWWKEKQMIINLEAEKYINNKIEILDTYKQNLDKNLNKTTEEYKDIKSNLDHERNILEFILNKIGGTKDE